MKHETLPKNDFEYNEKLYAFLATNYDIGDLARRISAAKNAKLSIHNLRKIIGNAS